MTKKRILTGIRPTGALHLGHYVGALHNWISLQDEYDCNFLIADYQALSDHFHETDMIKNSVIDVTLDWLSVGLDPEKSNFVIQSTSLNMQNYLCYYLSLLHLECLKEILH